MSKQKSRKINKVYVVAACRTPIGRIAGSLSNMSDVRLMTFAFEEAVRRTGVPSLDIDSVYVGCCFPQEPYNLARKVVLDSSLPDEIPATTINRTCCSSMEAFIQGVREIMVGDAQTVLVGGTENMSKTPHIMRTMIKKLRAKTNSVLPELHELKEIRADELGICAELSANEHHITREEQDVYAYQSYLKAMEAKEKGYLKKEIFPVEDDNLNIILAEDENIPDYISYDMLQKEEPIYIRNGTITKLNATSINDGSAAMVLMSENKVKELGIHPMAEYVDSESVGTPYREFAIAPKIALENLMKRNDLTINDLDLIEYNEAYAAQALLANELIKKHSKIINVNGGSLAIGHPVGCTGLRICVTLLFAMQRLNLRIGAASLCGGGGVGQCVLFRM